MKYRVSTGKLVVQARSRVHDTTTTWDKVTGDVDADANAIEGARATFTVDMTSFDAGDWLKNRKLRKDFDMEAHKKTFQGFTRLLTWSTAVIVVVLALMALFLV